MTFIEFSGLTQKHLGLSLMQIYPHMVQMVSDNNNDSFVQEIYICFKLCN